MPRLACALILSVAVLAGCKPGAAPATVKDLKLTLDAKAPAEGGLPAGFKLVVENSSPRPIRFKAPSPLCPEADLSKPSFPMLGISFDECDDKYSPAYTDLHARRVPPAPVVVLGPGQAWTHEYALKDFFFWGPCGPASDEDIGTYYRPGKTEIHMRAVLGYPPLERKGEEPGELPTAKSTPVVVRCSVRQDMLKTKGSP